MTNPPFGFDKPEDSPGFLLWQTTLCWQRLIKKALEPFDISHAQFVILAILLWFQGKNQDTTQVDIVNLSKLDKMTVSKSLKKLTALNLVHRSENEKDTRAKSVRLTKPGTTLIKKLVPIVEAIDHNFFSQLNAKDEKSLIRILRQLPLISTDAEH